MNIKKLDSEDIGPYKISKFLNENIPFSKKLFLPNFQKNEESDKLELVDFGQKYESSTPYNHNKYNSLSLTYNIKNQENSWIRTRKGNMKMYLYNNQDEPLIVLGPD